jgi:hypothetical protein
MILQTRATSAESGAQGVATCAECGTSVTGNFCSSCGADQRSGMAGVLGAVAGATRQSFPTTYLRILLAPVKETVRLADDPAYRQHISFLLSGLAIFTVIMVPFFLQSADPTGAAAQYSESMHTLMKVLSQVGVYAGAAITFVLGYTLFHFFAKTKRSLNSYLKLYCLAYGFMMPPYAIYDYVARGLLGSTGLSSFIAQNPTDEQILSVPFLISFILTLAIWAYFIAIHKRFWGMSVWKAGALYSVASLGSYQAAYWIMYFVGYYVAVVLIRMGVVTV